MNKPLSNEEIEQSIGPCVILYSDLEKYPTIQNLLPRNGEYVVILVREKKNSGHWVLLYRKGLHHYIYFNSYGYKWDTQMKEVLSKEVTYINKEIFCIIQMNRLTVSILEFV